MNGALYFGLLIVLVMLFLLFTLVACYIFICIDNYITDKEEKKHENNDRDTGRHDS